MSQPRKVEAPVVIIGGGIVGCAAAYYLAQKDVQALVLEKSVVGGGASGRNAGGVRAQCRDRRERLLAMASIKLWEGLQEELDADMEYVQDGNIRLATNEERMAQLEREVDEELADGLKVEVWDRAELRWRAPYLSDQFTGAKYCATDGIANPILSTWAFAWAAQRLGVKLIPHTEVVDIEMQDRQITSVLARGREGELAVETPLVVHAGGPWVPQLSQTLGVDIPVKPSRTVIAVTQRMPFIFKEFLSSHDVGVYARPACSGHIHVGGVGVRSYTFDKEVPLDTLNHLGRAIQMVPALEDAKLLRAWAGTLAMTPDGLPIVGPVDGIEGYLLATGFSGHGFCLGPITGQLLSELVVEGGASIPLTNLHLSRFSRKHA